MFENFLNEILTKQQQFQERLGYDVSKMNERELASYIKEQSLWVEDEIHEMIREIPYVKPWSSKYDLMTDEEKKNQMMKAKEEFIDIITFLFNVALALGFTAEEIQKMYLEKNKINHKRQDNNY